MATKLPEKLSHVHKFVYKGGHGKDPPNSVGATCKEWLLLKAISKI